MESVPASGFNGAAAPQGPRGRSGPSHRTPSRSGSLCTSGSHGSLRHSGKQAEISFRVNHPEPRQRRAEPARPQGQEHAQSLAWDGPEVTSDGGYKRWSPLRSWPWQGRACGVCVLFAFLQDASFLPLLPLPFINIQLFHSSSVLPSSLKRTRGAWKGPLVTDARGRLASRGRTAPLPARPPSVHAPCWARNPLGV